VNRVVVMDEGSQTYYSKTLADRMTAIYESVIALKDAVVGGERKKAIAEVFLQHTWKKDELDFDQLSLKHFDRIVEQKEQVNV